MDKIRIKKGEAVFGSEKIMLEESLQGHFSNILDMWREGDRLQKAVFIGTVFLGFFSLSFVLNFLLRASIRQIMFFATGLTSVLLIALVHKYLEGFTSEKVIQKENINSASFKPGKKLITHPRFILGYREDGEEKKRYVMMPISLMPGVEKDIEEMKEKLENLDISSDW